MHTGSAERHQDNRQEGRTSRSQDRPSTGYAVPYRWRVGQWDSGTVGMAFQKRPWLHILARLMMDLNADGMVCGPKGEQCTSGTARNGRPPLHPELRLSAWRRTEVVEAYIGWYSCETRCKMGQTIRREGSVCDCCIVRKQVPQGLSGRPGMNGMLSRDQMISRRS